MLTKLVKVILMEGAASAGEGRTAPRPRALFRSLMLLIMCGVFFLVGDRGCEAQRQDPALPPKEVTALLAIASKLQVKAGLPPCNRSTERNNATEIRSLNCDCDATTNICHVLRIQLKSQNLTGTLPEELAELKSLIEIDLSRNYLSGTIPASWASLPLVNISLLGNRLSGGIPDEFGNIRTLQELNLENNLLGGRLPSALGLLTNLTRLLLSANNFNGEIPESFGGLAKLLDFRIDGNAISGKIPDFIGKWSNLQRLDMQGTSLEGPFPATFSDLKSLAELRITDFKGAGDYPRLEAKKMRTLVLRNCNISNKIPLYISDMEKLKTLDLSFNNFTGEIPSFLQQLKQIEYMYLANNMLTGVMPDWLSTMKNADLSYNSFTGSTQLSCQNGKVNLVASHSSSESNLGDFCLRKNLPCSGKAKNYKLFINCGGRKEMVGTSEYEEDIREGPSLFYASGEKWAVSSTGYFIGGENSPYVSSNISVLSVSTPDTPALYMQARMSPVSLRYYGLCLQNGNYTVVLHFAEISFTNDQTYYGVGRRFFDVSIQGHQVLKDFNIAQKANGTGRAINQTFFALVENNTLEIHFQWAGKGTNSIPKRGVYGPLISAISVISNFDPEIEKGPLSVGAIVGITVSLCVVTFLLLFSLYFLLRKKRKDNDELKGLEMPGNFSLRQIKSATGNFNPVNKIGEGGFGPVYKGELSDGSLIAVKQLSSKSKQGSREFVNEIGMITALQHPNLVKLFGCCIEGNQLLLVYEYMENNSLARALFGPEGQKLYLDWQTRRKITLGIARGLAFLHEESRLKIVHRDIKATNILLDKDLNAKISDFGLAKLDDDENTHISTRIAGTLGYMAPEYAMRGYLTDKADVYSFGVVILEIVSGHNNASYRPKEECVYLLDQAYVLQERGALLELVDSCLGTAYSKIEAEQMLNLALLCTNPSPTLRPTMSAVVSILEGDSVVRAAPLASSRATGEEGGRFRSFETLSHDSPVIELSSDGPWIDSSATMSGKEDASLLSAASY